MCVLVCVCEIKHLVPPMAESTGRDASHDASSEGLYSAQTPCSGTWLREEPEDRTMPALCCRAHKYWIVAIALFMCTCCLHYFSNDSQMGLCKSSNGPKMFYAEPNIWTYVIMMLFSNIWSNFDEYPAVINRKCTNISFKHSSLAVVFRARILLMLCVPGK